MAVRRTRRGVRLVAAMVTATAVLAGCSGHPGAAAVVDGRTISTSELAAAFEELRPLYNGAGPQDVLGVLITEPFATELAAEVGTGVSDQQARDLLEQVAAQALGEEAAAGREFGPGALAVARYSVAVSELQGVDDPQAAIAEYQSRVLAADIEVNPRFGEFGENIQVAPPVTPTWIVPAGGRDAAAAGDAPQPGDDAPQPDVTPTP